MSLHALATGTLVADPQRREGRKGPFATTTIRVQTEDEAIILSVIAFGETAERLLALTKGDAVSVAGRAKLSTWTGRDGAERHGLSIVVDQIAAAKPQRPTDSPRAPHRRSPRAYRAAPAEPAAGAPAMADDPLDDLWPAA